MLESAVSSQTRADQYSAEYTTTEPLHSSEVFFFVAFFLLSSDLWTLAALFFLHLSSIPFLQRDLVPLPALLLETLRAETWGSWDSFHYLYHPGLLLVIQGYLVFVVWHPVPEKSLLVLFCFCCFKPEVNPVRVISSWPEVISSWPEVKVSISSWCEVSKQY